LQPIGQDIFYDLTNTLRLVLKNRYYQILAIHRRTHTKPRMPQLLPANLQHRVDSLIARQMSLVLWNPCHKTAVPPALQEELSILHDYLSDPEKPWRILIGHLIPRDPHFEFTGDAS
jgi:hypothetical protein